MAALDTNPIAVAQLQIKPGFSAATGKDVAEHPPNPGLATNRIDGSTTAIGLNTPGQEEEEEEEEEEEDTEDTAEDADDDGDGRGKQVYQVKGNERPRPKPKPN